MPTLSHPPWQKKEHEREKIMHGYRCTIYLRLTIACYAKGLPISMLLVQKHL